MPEWIFPSLVEGEHSEAGNARISLWAKVARLDALTKSTDFAGIFLPAANLFETGRLRRIAEASKIFGEVIFSLDEPSLERRGLQHYDDATLQKRSKFLLWASAALGDGILVPMGFEYGLDGRLAHPIGAAKSWFELAAKRSFDLSEDIAAANAFVGAQSGQFKSSTVAPLWPAGASKFWRRSGVRTTRHGCRVVLANPAMDREMSIAGFVRFTRGRRILAAQGRAATRAQFGPRRHC